MQEIEWDYGEVCIFLKLNGFYFYWFDLNR